MLNTQIPSAVVILIAVVGYGVVHSVLAALKTKALARQWFGRNSDRWYRIFYNVFAGVALVPLLALTKLLPDQPLYVISPPWVYITLVVQIGAVVILGAALMQTDTMAFLGLRQLWEGEKPGEKLVVQGVYKWVRHPLYTAGLLFIWFTPVMTMNILTLYISFTIYIIVGALFEERKLVREFGPAYERYKTQTPMLVPGLFIRRKSTNRF